MKYPEFEIITQKVWNLLMFDAELSSRYQGYCFDKLAGLLFPFFDNFFEEDIAAYQKRINQKKVTNSKAPFKDSKAYLEHLKFRNMKHREDNFCEEAFLNRNQEFDERFNKVVKWIWDSEKDRFIDSFKKYFIVHANQNFHIFKIDNEIEKWVNGIMEFDEDDEYIEQFSDIIVILQDEYSNNDFLSIGYQIADLCTLKNDLWHKVNLAVGNMAASKEPSNSELLEINKEKWINYGDQIANLTEEQEKYLDLNVIRADSKELRPVDWAKIKYLE